MTGRAAAGLGALAWAGLIFWLSSRPSLPAPGFPLSDKVFHFAAYFVLGLALSLAGLRPAAATAAGWAYGASDEVHQRFVPGRSADPLDWLADALGVAAAVYLHHRWRARRAPAPVRAPTADA